MQPLVLPSGQQGAGELARLSQEEDEVTPSLTQNIFNLFQITAESRESGLKIKKTTFQRSGRGTTATTCNLRYISSFSPALLLLLV